MFSTPRKHMNTIAQLYHNYRFLVFYQFFQKYRKIWFRIRTYVKSNIYPEIFIEIGPFFDFHPQPGRTLPIQAWAGHETPLEFSRVFFLAL